MRMSVFAVMLHAGESFEMALDWRARMRLRRSSDAALRIALQTEDSDASSVSIVVRWHDGPRWTCHSAEVEFIRRVIS